MIFIEAGKDMILAPQTTTYSIDGPWPERIGEQTHIRVHEFTWGINPWITKVILLADPSGRQWLVECK